MRTMTRFLELERSCTLARTIHRVLTPLRSGGAPIAALMNEKGIVRIMDSVYQSDGSLDLAPGAWSMCFFESEERRLEMPLVYEGLSFVRMRITSSPQEASAVLTQPKLVISAHVFESAPLDEGAQGRRAGQQVKGATQGHDGSNMIA